MNEMVRLESFLVCCGHAVNHEFQTFVDNVRQTRQITVNVKRKGFGQCFFVCHFRILSNNGLRLFGARFDEVNSFDQRDKKFLYEVRIAFEKTFFGNTAPC